MQGKLDLFCITDATPVVLALRTVVGFGSGRSLLGRSTIFFLEKSLGVGGAENRVEFAVGIPFTRQCKVYSVKNESCYSTAGADSR